MSDAREPAEPSRPSGVSRRWTRWCQGTAGRAEALVDVPPCGRCLRVDCKPAFTLNDFDPFHDRRGRTPAARADRPEQEYQQEQPDEQQVLDRHRRGTPEEPPAGPSSGEPAIASRIEVSAWTFCIR